MKISILITIKFGLWNLEVSKMEKRLNGNLQIFYQTQITIFKAHLPFNDIIWAKRINWGPPLYITLYYHQLPSNHRFVSYNFSTPTLITTTSNRFLNQEALKTVTNPWIFLLMLFFRLVHKMFPPFFVLLLHLINICVIITRINFQIPHPKDPAT